MRFKTRTRGFVLQVGDDALRNEIHDIENDRKTNEIYKHQQLIDLYEFEL